MADEIVGAESAQANPTQSQILYHAFRRARATWGLVLYAPEYIDDDVPEEINDPLSDADSDALNAYLLQPAETPRDLARKMRVFREQDIVCGWYKASEIVDVLVSDANRFACDRKGV